jgi:pectate lyase
LILQVKSLGTSGEIIHSEQQVGGAPVLRSAKPPKDTDQDGIPDEWENSHRLDPANAKDAQIIDPATGYSYLEEYINAVADSRSKQMLKLLNRYPDCK